MLKISRLSELAPELIDEVIELLFNNQASQSQSKQDIRNFITERYFDFGKFFWVALDEDQVCATIGAVVAELKRKEVFITGLASKESCETYFNSLLENALAELEKFEGIRVKLGIKDGLKVASGFPENLGFVKIYSLISMVYEGVPADEKSLEQIELRPLCTENIEDYINVSNESFQNTPNAATINREDADRMLNNKSLRCGLIYNDGVLKGSYELKICGGDGWIESIGILPAWQRHGLGKSFVEKLIYRLQTENIKNVRLNVIDTNLRAYRLYQKMNFKTARILSAWYELSP